MPADSFDFVAYRDRDAKSPKWTKRGNSRGYKYLLLVVVVIIASTQHPVSCSFSSNLAVTLLLAWIHIHHRKERKRGKRLLQVVRVERAINHARNQHDEITSHCHFGLLCHYSGKCRLDLAIICRTRKTTIGSRWSQESVFDYYYFQ